MHAYSLNKRSSYVSEFDVELRAILQARVDNKPQHVERYDACYLHSSFCRKLTFHMGASKRPNQIRHMSIATNDMRSSRKLSIIALCKSKASQCSLCMYRLCEL